MRGKTDVELSNETNQGAELPRKKGALQSEGSVSWKIIRTRLKPNHFQRWEKGKIWWSWGSDGKDTVEMSREKTVMKSLAWTEQ